MSEPGLTPLVQTQLKMGKFGKIALGWISFLVLKPYKQTLLRPTDTNVALILGYFELENKSEGIFTALVAEKMIREPYPWSSEKSIPVKFRSQNTIQVEQWQF